MVAAGGAVGATMRFLTTNYIKYLFPVFPLGTLIVNIIGSFCIGFLISYMENRNISSNIIRYFIIIGILGSFTTFSSFSIEIIEMLNSRKFFIPFFYVISSLFTCIFFCYVGYNLNKI